jgi:hypothetical protein
MGTALSAYYHCFEVTTFEANAFAWYRDPNGKVQPILGDRGKHDVHLTWQYGTIAPC